MSTKAICGSYVNSILAKREALKARLRRGDHARPQGFVAEATGENVFIVKGG